MQRRIYCRILYVPLHTKQVLNEYKTATPLFSKLACILQLGK